MKRRSRQRQTSGYSLIELMITLAVLAAIASLVIPLYRGYRQEGQISRVIEEMKQIELGVENHRLDTGAYPDSLAEIGIQLLDPWGNSYQYLRIEGASQVGKGKQRKDHNLVPINSDFDLYSMGEDGDTTPPLTAPASWDDIVRANNGGFYGYGKDY